jgi:hypothetical protein
MSAQRRKEKTLQAVLAQSERLSVKQPVLMIGHHQHARALYWDYCALFSRLAAASTFA